jgi:hypothetical protein
MFGGQDKRLRVIGEPGNRGCQHVIDGNRERCGALAWNLFDELQTGPLLSDGRRVDPLGRQHAGAAAFGLGQQAQQ